MIQNLFSYSYDSALIAGGVALFVAVLLVATQNWHGHLSLDSNIGVQKFHIHPTPRVGGIAIFLGIIAGYLMSTANTKSLLGPLILAGIPAFAIGLFEDITKQVSISFRLLTTMLCGVLGWALTGFSITAANVPILDWLLSFTVISVLFTAFAVGGLANAINIIDGFNGLAAGTIIAAVTAFGLICASLDDSDLAVVCLIVACAMVGFLIVNWPLGKIFLGDGGAYFVGFSLAWLSVLILKRHSEVSAWAPLVACSYPILEVGFSFARKTKRIGHHPGQPDSVHLHMLLNRRVARKFFPSASKTFQNSLTSTFTWPFAIIPACFAVFFYKNTVLLAFVFISLMFIYYILYLRLSQFCWCFTSITLKR